MDLIGHRGCGGQYPENTIEAVARTVRHLDAVEVDVRRCASGELVVFHDESVERLTNASGAVADLTWDELRELEVLESGETIPRLPELLDTVPPDVRLQIELKETGLAADVYKHVAGRELDVAVSSFLPTALEEVRTLDWDVPAGYLFGDAPDENLRRALELDCAAVHPHYDLCLQTDIVEAAHAEELRVVAWKAVETFAEAETMRSVGVDGVTADRWDIAGDRDDAARTSMQS